MYCDLCVRYVGRDIRISISWYLPKKDQKKVESSAYHFARGDNTGINHDFPSHVHIKFN